jgi:hypothetical protein
LGPIDVSGQPNFENTSFGRPILFIFTTLTTQNLCSVSIVKRGATIVTHFWVPAQKIIKYKKKIKKILSKNNSSEKRMPKRPKNGQKLVEEVQNYKD